MDDWNFQQLKLQSKTYLMYTD